MLEKRGEVRSVRCKPESQGWSPSASDRVMARRQGLRMLPAASITLVIIGVAAPALGQNCPSPAAVADTQCTVPPGTIITATPAGAVGLSAAGPAGRITGDGISVNLAAAATRGAQADLGGTITFNGSSIGTIAVGAAANGQIGLHAVGTGSTISATGAVITLAPASGTTSNLLGAFAEGGASINLTGTSVLIRGGANGTGNYGLVASGPSTIIFTGGSVDTLSRGAFGVLAQFGGQIVLSGGTTITTAGLQNSATNAGSHALIATGAGSTITATGITVTTSGALANAARAEEGGTVTLVGSSVSATGAGNTLNPAAALRVTSGGGASVTGGTITTTGGLFSHGISIEGAGSQAALSGTTINVAPTVASSRAIGINVLGGVLSLADSTLTVSANGTRGLNSEGGTITLVRANITTNGATGSALVAGLGSVVTIDGGSITTNNRDAAGLSAGNSTLTATNVTIATTGSDTSMGAVANDVSRIELTGGSVTTSGDAVRDGARPHGLVARNPGGTLIATGTAVITRGAEAMGVVADDGGTVRLSALSVRTEDRLNLGPRGTGAIGLFSVVEQAGLQFAADITADNTTVETLGPIAHGALAQQNFLVAPATITLNDSVVTTRGAGAIGLRAVSAGTIVANRSTVLTEGVGAHGLLARDDPSSVTVNQTTVTATGAVAHGAAAQDGGRITGVGATVNAAGDGAAALFAIAGEGTTSIATFIGSSLSNRSGPTIAVAGASNILLTNTTVGGSGQWLRVGVAGDFPPLAAREQPITGVPDLPPDPDAPIPPLQPGPGLPAAPPPATSGLANIIASGSTLTGSAFTAPGSVSNVALLNNTVWNMTADSNLTNLINDASLIAYSPPGPDGLFRTLVAGTYVGRGGTLGMNTFLGTDGSPSDRLLISGGTASGTTSLVIANAGGLGALTTGNGILVVDGINGGTTQPGAFSLGRPVVAGPYEYTLFRSSRDGTNAQAWYLRSTLPPQPPEPAPSPPDPSPGPSPQPSPSPAPPIPNYRGEVSLYVAIPSMIQTLGLAMLDNLHDRVGEEEHLRGRADLSGRTLANGAWVRLIAQHSSRDGGGLLRDGPRFQQEMFGLQAGLDLFRRESASGHRDHAGLYIAVGSAMGDVDHSITGTRAGRVRIDGYTFGAYWTHFGPSGWYLDAVAQITSYDVRATSARLGLRHSGDATGYAASLEGGYPIALGQGWIIEPQAQLIFQRIAPGSGGDEAARIHFDDADSLIGRLSARLARSWRPASAEPGDPRQTTAWFRAGIYHEFLGESRMDVSSAAGPVRFRSDLGGTWAGFNVGVSAQVTPNATLFANANYHTDFSGNRSTYGGRFGIRVNW